MYNPAQCHAVFYLGKCAVRPSQLGLESNAFFVDKPTYPLVNLGRF